MQNGEELAETTAAAAGANDNEEARTDAATTGEGAMIEGRAVAVGTTAATIVFATAATYKCSSFQWYPGQGKGRWN